MRKDLIVTGEAYHIYNRSIADYRIFNNDADYERMKQLIFYSQTGHPAKYSDFITQRAVFKNGFYNMCRRIRQENQPLVQIIAYCIMPTHIHLIIKQLRDNGIPDFTKKVFECYTKYFNLQHKRKGPLWESRYKNVLVDNDEQLLHLTRYFHLNPVTAKIIDCPEKWEYSSYKEYVNKSDTLELCEYRDLINIYPKQYKKFVQVQKSYQRELAKIKKHLLDS